MASVLHVLLTILKVLGIAILIILGIALILLLTVLFVPVRYKADGEFEGKDINACASVTWLFKLLHVRAVYKYSKPLHIQLKILGISFYDNLKEKKVKKSKISQKAANETKEAVSETIEADADDAKKDEASEDIDIRPASIESETNDEKQTKVLEKSDEKKVKKDKNRLFSKISGVFKNIKFTFEKICDSIKKVRDNIEYYVKLVNHESTKAAIGQCKKQLFKLIKLVCPRKYRINLHLGFDDPSIMGEVLAIWGMLYPFHMGRIDIRPEFETAVIEGSFNIKGHICIASVVKAAVIMYFDKNIKLLIKRLRR